MSLLKANGNNLTGNNPLVKVAAVRDGNADITPGSFTPEVQSIVVHSLSVAGGSFKIDFEGRLTEPISVHASGNAVKR